MLKKKRKWRWKSTLVKKKDNAKEEIWRRKWEIRRWKEVNYSLQVKRW